MTLHKDIGLYCDISWGFYCQQVHYYLLHRVLKELLVAKNST